MYVIKRSKCSLFRLFYNFQHAFDVDQRTEEVHLDKITSRIQKLCYGLNMDFVDPVSSPSQHLCSRLRIVSIYRCPSH